MQDNRTERWFSQRWIFDNAIRTLGVEPFTGGSLTRAYEAIGNDIIEDSHELNSRVKKFSDITRECKRIASRRESHAKDSESLDHVVAARENYFVASVMYGCARWPIWENNDSELLQLTEKITGCYSKYAAFSDHHIERLEIPFEGKKIFANLHLPPQSTRPQQGASKAIPCVVVIPGMDTFKEELVRLYGDKFLQRGLAVAVVDGPGQGESVARGLKLTTTNFDRAGKAVMDYLIGLDSNLDGDRIGLFAGRLWNLLGSSHSGVRSKVCLRCLFQHLPRNSHEDDFQRDATFVQSQAHVDVRH